MEDKEQTWYYAKVKIAKNKIAAPFKTAELPVKWNMWYDKISDIIEASVLLKTITKSWAFYTLGNQKFQWKEKLAQHLAWDPKALAELEKKIENAIKDMRMWKQVLDNETFEHLDEVIEDISGVENDGE